MVADVIDVLRMVWHPSQIVGGNLQTSVFPAKELLADGGAYSSVDDVNLLSKPAVDWRIDSQQKDGRAERLGRHAAFFAVLNTGKIRSWVEEDGPLFYLTREKTEPDEEGPGSPANPAHCGIRSCRPERFEAMTPAQKRAEVSKRRTKLLQVVEGIMSYADLFAEPAGT